jgi:hypothetical protein
VFADPLPKKRACQVDNWQLHKNLCKQSNLAGLSEEGLASWKRLSEFSLRYSTHVRLFSSLLLTRSNFFQFNDFAHFKLTLPTGTDFLVQLIHTPKASHFRDGTNVIRVLNMLEVSSATGSNLLRCDTPCPYQRVIFQLDCGDGIIKDEPFRRHLLLSHRFIRVPSPWWTGLYPSDAQAEHELARAVVEINRILYAE